MMTINNVSTETKVLQTRLTGKQQRLNKLSSDVEMTVADKEKERRKIKQEIAELNRKLRQERLKEQDNNKELQKEEKKKKVIKEELMQEMNPDNKGDSEISKVSASSSGHEEKKTTPDLPVVTLKNMVAADSSIRMSEVETQVSHATDKREGILVSEIQLDRLYGTDTTEKQAQLSKMRRNKGFQIESLHKKEDTPHPSMDSKAKIIIRE